MQNTSRIKRLFSRYGLRVSVTLGVLALVWGEFNPHARRDAALIAAIQDGDATTVRLLLARGADPNARDASELPPIFLFSGLVTRLDGVLGYPHASSALDIAVGLDMQLLAEHGQLEFFSPLDRDPRADLDAPKRESMRSIIEMLVRTGARTCSQPRGEGSWLDEDPDCLIPGTICDPAPTESSNLGWCEEWLASHPDKLQPIPADNGASAWEWAQAARVVVRVPRRDGAYGLHYAGLGECQLRLNDYTGAARSFGLALLWMPSDAALCTGLARAQAADGASRAILRLLPDASDAVLAVRAYPGRAGVWAAITSAGEDTPPYNGVNSVGLYAADNGTAHPLFPPLKLPGGAEFDGPVGAVLFVSSGDSRSRTEIAVCGDKAPNTDTPVVNVFAALGGKIVPLRKVRGK